MTLTCDQMTLTCDQRELLKYLQKVANQRVCEEGTFTEFTGIIGELAACQQFGYRWKSSTGYDAKDENCKKIQIKTRRRQTSTKFRSGTLGRFGKKNEDKYTYDHFDIGILVILDHEFKIKKVWESDSSKIQKREHEKRVKNADGSLKPLLNGLTINQFQGIAKPIWPK